MVIMNSAGDATTLTIAAGSIGSGMNHMGQLDDDDDDCPSSPNSSAPFDDDGDLMSSSMGDDVTAQLAAAGPVGVAAAAAIASAKKRKRPHSFETNPSIRKRQQTRLLRKLRQTIDEFATRVGQQAVVVVATPGKPQNSFKVFGAKPLEDVVRNLRSVIMQELESALAQQAPPPTQDDPSLHELPPLVIDGIPTPVEKMTQAQLRAFIPLMLKYSTGRGKPGWGKESTRPPWWPEDLPWANVRMDARTEEEKQKVSWTHALRQIVINCYKYHGREDLLPAFSEDDENGKNISPSKPHKSTPQVTTAPASAPQVAQYAPTVLQTISNPDGTVSIIQVDPSNPIITLPDGTTAQVQGVAAIQTQADGSSTVQTLAEVAAAQGGEDGSVTVDLNNVAQATLNQDGQIILTGEDGHAYPVTVSGMITVPVPASMYQTVVANISQLQSQGEGTTMQVMAPVMQVPKVEPGTGDTVETITVTPTVVGTPVREDTPSIMAVSQSTQVLQVTAQVATTSSSETEGEVSTTITTTAADSPD